MARAMIDPWSRPEIRSSLVGKAHPAIDVYASSMIGGSLDAGSHSPGSAGAVDQGEDDDLLREDAVHEAVGSQE